MPAKKAARSVPTAPRARRRPVDSLPFDSIHLEGSLFVPAELEKVTRGQASHQSEADYRIPKGLRLDDEISRAFRIATAEYAEFHQRLDIEATRRFVTALLKSCLGYEDFSLLTAPITLHDLSYPVTAQASAGTLPIVIAAAGVGLDESSLSFGIQGSGSRKRTPGQLAQQYINAEPRAAWAIITNGHALRLIRDSDSLTQPRFLEFNLAAILHPDTQGGRFADFRALWRILHATRATVTAAHGCIWEEWRKAGLDLGSRVRESLRTSVESALITLGSGFISHPANQALRDALLQQRLSKDDLFNQLLRLVYRWLFLFCAEERNLLHPQASSVEQRKLYETGYSLRRLRSRCLRRAAADAHTDLWAAMTVAFRALAVGEPRLALAALGGLFAPHQCPDLDTAQLSNAALLEAMRQLRWSRATGTLTAVDYRNMGPEELGSIYESLLELVPSLDLTTRRFGFVGLTDEGSTSGNARKTTGSYYTPDSLVQELIKSALDPVIADRLAARPDRPIDALLSITVCDPSCGSGHFLLAAARRLAEKLAELRAPDGAARPDDYRHALREVIARCIHGVDRNPLALELARTVLWLEGVDPGMPLSFLDHHLVCGDALLGLTDLSQLEKGIPDDAFTALSGDDRKLCSDLKKHNKAARKQLDDLRKGQDLLSPPGQPDALAEFSTLESLPEATPEEIAAKEAAYLAFLSHTRESPLARAADVFIGAFLAPKNQGSDIPTTAHLAHALFPAQNFANPEAQAHSSSVIQHSSLAAAAARALHWPLAFPKVFARGGFDCILGNPPWERIKLQEEEFFATRSPAIANAKNKAERARLITALTTSDLPADQQLHSDFITARRTAEAASVFAHVDGKEGGRFPLTGVGDVNTYALFSETITQLTAKEGRAGFIVPTGIVSDDTTKQFFSAVAETGRLIHLFSFENEEFVFPAVHHSFRFCLMVIAGAPDLTRSSVFVFLARQTDQLTDDRRRFTLSPKDFRLINPNTRTCPILRARADAELTRTIYRRVPVLIEEARDGQPEKNPWGIRFQTMFHMSADSGLFEDKPGADLLPLYEAKMIHQFDHRWASYTRTAAGELDTADVTAADKADPAFAVTPRYWVPRSAVEQALLSKQDPLYPLHLAAREKRRDSLAWWFRCWLWGHELLAGNKETAAQLRQEMDDARIVSHDTMEIVMAHEPERLWAECSAKSHPLTNEEQQQLWQQIMSDDGLISRDPRILGGKNSDQLSEVWESIAASILARRSRSWLLPFRDICRSHDLRTVITTIVPIVALGNTSPIITISKTAYHIALLVGNLNALCLDYIARQKVGGIHLTYSYLKQLPILPPEAYSEADLAYIVPRVLDLTYTAHDLLPWAEDVISSYQRQFPHAPPLSCRCRPGQPAPFDPDFRAQLRADLDARYVRLYGLTRDELRYILDPADTHGPTYPTETFRVLKANELKQFGEYRTRRLVLDAWDRESIKTVTVSPAKPHIPADADGLSKNWQDTAFVLLAPKRKLVHNYSLAVWPELIRQMGDDLDFETFRKAYRLLCEPEEFETEGRKLFPDIPATWWQSRREKLDAASFIPSLKGSATIGDLKIWRAHGERRIRWTGSLPTSLIHEAVDDARIALQIASQWTDDLDQTEMAEIESILLTLETA